MAAASEADWCFPPFLFNEQWEQEEGRQRCSAQTCSGRQESPAAPTDGAAPTQTMTPVGMAALAEAALTHRHVGIHRCIPHPSFHGGQPVLPVHLQDSAHLEGVLHCPPEHSWEDARRSFHSLLSQGQPQAQALPVGSSGLVSSPVLEPFASTGNSCPSRQNEVALV